MVVPRDDDERVSLGGLTPEEALRALLAVKPEPPEADSDRADDDQPRRGHRA